MKFTTSKYYVCIFSFLLAVLSFEVAAGCLDGLTTTRAVTSKVGGVLVGKANTVHYVILDKATCTAPSSGDVTLGSETIKYHRLYIDDADKAMISTLLSAQARDETVYFRIWHNLKSNFNQLVYVIVPSDAVQ